MVYIIVLNWNGSEDTIACISSLLCLKHQEFKIVIIDNNSSDNSLAKIKEYLNDKQKKFAYYTETDLTNKVGNDSGIITIVTSSLNRGYAGGNNLGISYALSQDDCKYIWVLNNDTEVDEYALDKLTVAISKDSTIGILGSKLIYWHDKKTIQGLGGKYFRWKCKTTHVESYESASKTYNDDEISRSIDYIIGAALFFNASALKKIGLFNDDYFLYFEELDICLRAKQKGYQIKTISDSVVYHKEGATISKERSDFSEYHYLRSNKIFIRKFYPKTMCVFYLILLIKIFNRVRRNKIKSAKAILRVILNK